jgi:Mg-chelatase subunit ChlD
VRKANPRPLAGEVSPHSGDGEGPPSRSNKTIAPNPPPQFRNPAGIQALSEHLPSATSAALTSEEVMKSAHILAASALAATLAFSSQAAQAGIKAKHERVEVAFVLDTTGSMADLIEGAKQKIWSIANTIVDNNPDAEIAMSLVAYRDEGDDYVVLPTPLSEDIQGLYGNLRKLDANGGGDTPESVNAALDHAVNKLKWSSDPDVKRIVFLVGDAPPHMDYQQEKQYPAIMKDALKRDIVVNTVQAGDMLETTPIWKEIAQMGDGRFMAIPQSGGEVVVIVTPYDDDIQNLQRQLDGTVVPYGDLEQQSSVRNKLEEKAAAPASTQADNSKYYAKRSAKEVVTGSGDLIGDIRNNRATLEGIADKDLPEDLRKQSPEERKVWYEENLNKRMKLEAQMTDLIQKRDAFIDTERSKTAEKKPADSFDAAVEDTLRTQLN